MCNQYYRFTFSWKKLLLHICLYFIVASDSRAFYLWWVANIYCLHCLTNLMRNLRNFWGHKIATSYNMLQSSMFILPCSSDGYILVCNSGVMLMMSWSYCLHCLANMFVIDNKCNFWGFCVIIAVLALLLH